MKQSHRVSYVCNLYLYKFEYCRTKNKQDKTVFQKLKKPFFGRYPSSIGYKHESDNFATMCMTYPQSFIQIR